MASPVRKFLIFAAVDGLVIQPLQHRHQPALRIEYETHKINQTTSKGRTYDGSLECYGIIGILRLSPLGYLLTISGREEVAQVNGVPIYTLSNVSLISLASQREADVAIREASKALQRQSQPTASPSANSLSDDDNSADECSTLNENDGAELPELTALQDGPNPQGDSNTDVKSNVAQDVIGRRGFYGRFAESWFSKKGWTAEGRRKQGMSGLEWPSSYLGGRSVKTKGKPGDNEKKGIVSSTEANPQGSPPPGHLQTPANSNAYTLLPKLLRTTQMLFSSRSFFFSYDTDITKPLGKRKSERTESPLARVVNPLYFWNSALAEPFLKGPGSAFVVPLMQGFVGQRTFTVTRLPTELKDVVHSSNDVPKKDEESSEHIAEPDHEAKFTLTLISRRSILRPGLRYLRRGIDDDGNCANTVETEQILTRLLDSGNVQSSFLQIRGSIPLFFSQSPYSFKPVPVRHFSDESNRKALRRHFVDLEQRYGNLQVISLVDKTGGEQAIGEDYQKYVDDLNKSKHVVKHLVAFEWFDFHHVCRGMKFENVSILVDAVWDRVGSFGMTWTSEHGTQTQQNGVPRTNCMDCLDRTNVVQSALGQRSLEEQLKLHGFQADFRGDSSTQWFNSLWADNGDAISKQYSSTSALKGDYTRTRHRNYRGALNDFGLTLSRYYHNVVNDFFLQAAIDYLLENVTVQVFEDFEENLMSRDPGISIQKIRQNAINTSTRIVIEDEAEDFISGWTLLSPKENDTLRPTTMEESVVLLTASALYKVQFDWMSEKVSSFIRVDLDHIEGITKGTYVTSTLTTVAADESRNGFVIRYKPGVASIERVNTRSLDNQEADGLSPRAENDSSRDRNADASTLVPNSKESRILAFKVLPVRYAGNSSDHEEPSWKELDILDSICNDLRDTISKSVGRAAGEGLLPITEQEIISLQEARKNTSLVDQGVYSLKRLVWG